jgi:hypothetical protein
MGKQIEEPDHKRRRMSSQLNPQENVQHSQPPGICKPKVH